MPSQLLDVPRLQHIVGMATAECFEPLVSVCLSSRLAGCCTSGVFGPPNNDCLTLRADRLPRCLESRSQMAKPVTVTAQDSTAVIQRVALGVCVCVVHGDDSACVSLVSLPSRIGGAAVAYAP
jgi:hypothetical protein